MSCLTFSSVEDDHHLLFKREFMNPIHQTNYSDLQRSNSPPSNWQPVYNFHEGLSLSLLISEEICLIASCIEYP